jgi:hypothetical protein
VKTRAEKTGRNISKKQLSKFLHTTFLLSNPKVCRRSKQITKQNNIINHK